jgi:hypothetical protein
MTAPSGILCFAVRTMAAGSACGTTSERLSLQGFAFRKIAEAGPNFFSSPARSVTTAGQPAAPPSASRADACSDSAW